MVDSTLPCELITVGKLPKHRPSALWGGPGSGKSCAVCGKTIETGDVEMELQFTSEGGTGTANYHVHARCYAVWERERQNRDANSDSLPRGDDGGIIPSRERNTTNRGERG